MLSVLRHQGQPAASLCHPDTLRFPFPQQFSHYDVMVLEKQQQSFEAKQTSSRKTRTSESFFGSTFNFAGALMPDIGSSAAR